MVSQEISQTAKNVASNDRKLSACHRESGECLSDLKPTTEGRVSRPGVPEPPKAESPARFDSPSRIHQATQSIVSIPGVAASSARVCGSNGASTAPTPNSSEEVSGMPKLGNGCIFKHTNNSGQVVWKVEVTAGKDFKGNRRRIRRTARTYNDAMKLQRAMLRQLDEGTLGSTSSSNFENYAEWWLENVVAMRVRPTTLADYRARLKLNAYPGFGHRRLAEITSRDLQEWLVSLKKAGKATTTVNGALQVARAVFDYASAHGDLSKNPATLVRKLTKRSDEPTAVMAPWSLEESIQVLDAAKGTKFDLFISFGILFGLRRGEILGLQWNDFDFLEGAVTISRTLKEFRKLDSNGTGRVELVTDDPKTGSSRRKFYLPPPLLSAIQRHREFVAGLKRAAGNEWQLTEFVFVSSRGTAVFPSNMTESFAAFLKTQGLRHIRVHDMRHTAAVLGLTAGVRLEAVSQGLGHSRTDITKSIYAPHVQQLNDEFTRGLSELVMPSAEKHDLNPISPEAQHA